MRQALPSLEDQRQKILRDFTGPNLGYLLQQFERFRHDPQGVAPSDRDFLASHQEALAALLVVHSPSEAVGGTVRGSDPGLEARAVRALRLVRRRGHRAASFDPLEPASEPLLPLEPEVAALATEAVNPGLLVPVAGGSVGASWERLRRTYAATIGYEFDHLDGQEERTWLYEAAESGHYDAPLSDVERRILMHRLIEVEEFEHFLHTTFPGQKRFSIEGTDMLVPMLDESVRLAAAAGAGDVLVGMAHRGRLNVLAHVLGKPYDVIMEEFHAAPSHDFEYPEGSLSLSHGWTGDVKYHLGLSRTVSQDGAPRPTVRVTLANNPSHLEFVNPVVEGMARASQDIVDRPGTAGWDPDQALAILIHGDAAFPGEGVTAETLNLSGLYGFTTGGALHIIANNGLGFTTDPSEGRSTRYASDLAKGFDIPVVHVSADRPEDCIRMVRLAHAYRRRFHKDFLIDLVGYRRWGHNEGDDPAYTQPLLYARVARHPTVRRQWADALIAAGLVTREEEEKKAAEVQARMREAYEAVRNGDGGIEEPPSEPPVELPGSTGVPEAAIRAIHEDLFRVPEGFHLYPKLERVVRRWREALDKPGAIDWALGEMLAWGTILADGTPVRVSGQDTERGTFSQRHGVWHDAENGEIYRPLQHLPQARASFALYNSPLSEAGVVGFEYGYSVERPESLVCWEAQFGDFANAAQVHIDQFLAAGHAKWRQDAGLVLLLPHAYEGQGAEHSSARLERFLTLSAEDNWRVAYPTTAAQYFHLLRAQARINRQHPMPLIVMTPKSLLRHPRAASSLADFTGGRFQPLLVKHRPEGPVKRLVFLSGKFAVDLLAALEEHQDAARTTMVVAVEQLYPTPDAELDELFAEVREADVVWAQEEPENMGAWWFIRPHLARRASSGRVTYAGRPPRSSPAEGLPDVHVAEQARIAREALYENGEAPVISGSKGARHGR